MNFWYYFTVFTDLLYIDIFFFSSLFPFYKYFNGQSILKRQIGHEEKGDGVYDMQHSSPGIGLWGLCYNHSA